MGFLTTPLDSAFGSRSKVRLLRLLVEQDRTVSAREAARLTGSTNPAMLAAVNELAKLGLIHREISGRQFLCRANRDHRLFKTFKRLFRDESHWPATFFDTIRASLTAVEQKGGIVSGGRAHVTAAWLFGSAATGEDKPGSDIDLFVLTSDDEGVQRILEAIADNVAGWRKEFGADVRPVVMAREQVATQLRKDNRFLRRAIRSARMIMGEIPRELCNGKTHNDTKNR
ncbi:MAG: nucleotidyltransferase domain-containing protein [Gemmatimonadaceae bacterium]